MFAPAKAKGPGLLLGLRELIGRRPTLPPTCASSTIGAVRLNFRVRYGNGCDPHARITQTVLPDSMRAEPGGDRIFDGRQEGKYRANAEGKFYGQAERAISNGKLNVLLRLHIRPINVVVFHGPS